MSCRRAFEIDLAAFLASPRDAAWDDFRAHYPTCPACAAEVAAWTELETRLGADAHPEPAVLLRWSEQPDALALDERRRLARHLDGCPSCAEELRALGRFDAAGLASAAAVTAVAEAAPRTYAAAAPKPPSPAPGRRRSPLRVVGRVLWHPAFAWAAVMVLALTTLIERHGDVAVSGRRVGVVAKDAAPSAERKGAPAKPEQAPPPAARLSERSEAPRGRAAEPAPAERAGRHEAQDDEREAPARPQAPASHAAKAKAARPAPEGDAAIAEAPPPPPAPSVAAPEPAPEAAPAPPRDPAAATQGQLARQAPLGGAAGPRPLTVAVQPGDPTSALYMTLPESARGGGELEVRIAAVAGERELRQRVTLGSTSRIAAMSVPSTWLVTGRYVVTLWRDDRELGSATLDVP